MRYFVCLKECMPTIQLHKRVKIFGCIVNRESATALESSKQLCGAQCFCARWKQNCVQIMERGKTGERMRPVYRCQTTEIFVSGTEVFSDAKMMETPYE